MAQVFGLWHGGSSYSSGDPKRDMEAFNSIAHAARVLRHREIHNSGRYDIETFFVHREPESVRMPAVEGSSIELYPDADGGKPYLKLSIGPKGGLVRKNY